MEEPFSLKQSDPDRVMPSGSMNYKKNLRFHLKVSHFYHLNAIVNIVTLTWSHFPSTDCCIKIRTILQQNTKGITKLGR